MWAYPTLYSELFRFFRLCNNINDSLFSPIQNFHHQWQRTKYDSPQVDKSQTHANSAKKCKNLPQKNVAKWLILYSQSSKRNSKTGPKTKRTGTQCTQQKLKLISGWSHSRYVNTIPQRIARSSSRYPPKSQRKYDPINLLPRIQW